MSQEAFRRATVYLESGLHQALRLKAGNTRRSVSHIVNDAVRAALQEDEADLAAFHDRGAEPKLSLKALLRDLRRHGKH